MQQKKKRGLALVSLERRREIAAMGGAAVSKEKRSFSRDRALAKEAGRIGGSRTRRRPDEAEAERADA